MMNLDIKENTSKTHLATNKGLPKLSAREGECLSYLLEGLTAKEMSRALGISHRTVEAYINSLKNKLGVQRKIDIIVYAFKSGLVSLDEEQA